MLPFRDHFHMLMYPPRLLLRLRLPSDHPNSIHPALLNSLYLAACCISGGQTSGYESRFLNQARMESEHALAFVDRLVDFMWASVVLASYYLRRGRIVEAHNMILGTVGFAMAVGLHRAPGTLGPESIILPPADEIEKHDRVVLWYALTQLEASISMRIGLPTVTPKDVCSPNSPHNTITKMILHHFEASNQCRGVLFPVNSKCEHLHFSITRKY